MHFLCLHGRGTNSKVFEMQTAAIRYELGDHHTYDFVEGVVPWETDPEIKHLLPGGSDTYTYFDYTSEKSTRKAVDDFEMFLQTDGPYDGVIAFSQAASLVGTWMLRRVKRGGDLGFKCAIFLSAALLPYDVVQLEKGCLHLVTTSEVGEAISIPTAHVWGEEDQFSSTAKDFTNLCKSDVKSVLVHKGGHEVPGGSSREAVSRAVNIIRRAIQLSAAA
ncbi:putative serine hydrolase FSH [Rosellinia necatrix]|uniref:Putative serine hydrolase FSH n=1 Tax=Rosellinia necatrix TaxID=77044 RepID=A0A1W2TRJ5_ROSNE|nr:putative serine hydrolase FSH [Rosellinia necatrix]